MPDNEGREAKSGYFRIVVRGFLALLLLIIIFFIAAGRVTYWQAWVFSAACVLLLLSSSILFADKADLVRERTRPGPGTKWWDKVFWAFYAPAYLAIIIVAVLDAGRFGWTPQLPTSVYVAGYVVFAFANVCHLWAMWANRFFSSVVRIQSDRGHEVVSDGPYRFVRHPGYVGGILLGMSIAVVLGSLWALIPACVVAILLVVRTHLEDIMLQKELPGYAEYADEVRYRLLPGVW